MELLTTLISLAEKHQKSLIVVLIGIIIAGGVAGEIRISDLQSTIQAKNELVADKDKTLSQLLGEKEKLFEESQNLIEERYKNKMAALLQQNKYLSQQLEVLRPSATEMAKTLVDIESVLRIIKTRQTPSQSDISHLEELRASLDRQTLEVGHAVYTMGVISRMESESKMEGLPKEGESQRPWGPSERFPLDSRRVLLRSIYPLIVFVSVLILLPAAYVSWKFKELRRKEAMFLEMKSQGNAEPHNPGAPADDNRAMRGSAAEL